MPSLTVSSLGLYLHIRFSTHESGDARERVFLPYHSPPFQAAINLSSSIKQQQVLSRVNAQLVERLGHDQSYGYANQFQIKDSANMFQSMSPV